MYGCGGATLKEIRNREALGLQSGGGITNRSWPPIDFLEIPANATVREAPPNAMSEDEESEFRQTLGAALRGSGTTNRRVDIYLGVDMGTSSTKVVARLPYVADSPCIPIPAPRHCRSGGHPALWQTVLWRRDKTYTALPESDARPIRNLKQAAVRAAADGLRPGGQTASAAAAYLGYVIRHAKGWLLANRASLFTNLDPRWIVQVGLPAKSCDDLRLAKAYRQIALGAVEVSSEPGDITTDVISKHLGDGDIALAADSNEMSLERGVAVFPEIAAATTSFSKSNERANGLYLIVDVGAMTLDVCTFQLGQEGGKDTYSVFEADVRPLGVDALRWFRGMEKSDQELAEQICWCLLDVVRVTKLAVKGAPEFEDGSDLPVFVVGGGSRSRFHQEQIKNVSQWMQKHYAHEGLRLIDMGFTTALDMAGILEGQRRGAPDLSRLVVALGLSYPDDEIGELTLPSRIPSIQPDQPLDHRRNFVSKDYV